MEEWTRRSNTGAMILKTCPDCGSVDLRTKKLGGQLLFWYCYCCGKVL